MATGLLTLLSARVINNKAVQLSARQGVKITFYGSSMLCSIPSLPDQVLGTHRTVDELTIYPDPDEGKGGIIAVSVLSTERDHKGKPWSDTIFAFFEVIWRGNHPFINLDETWTSPERIGQLTQKDQIIVTIRNRRYCSYNHHQWKNGESQPTFVPDSDLLCRYLYGTASAADVLHAAVQHKLEESAKSRVEKLSTEVARLELERSRWETDARSIGTKLFEARESNGLLRESLRNFADNELSGSWKPSHRRIAQRIRELLDSSPRL